MRQLKARDIMSTPVIAVRWDAAIPEIVSTMRRHGISGVPVLNEFGLLCGVITEADILNKEAGHGGLDELSYVRRDTHEGLALARQSGNRADEIMVCLVVTATLETPVAEIARTMIRQRVNRVPIVEDENLLGIVTRADVLALFDRSPTELLAAVKKVMSDELLMDPNRFEIVVVNGIVQVRGRILTLSDIELVEKFLTRIDGVVGVDTSRLVVDEPMEAR